MESRLISHIADKTYRKNKQWRRENVRPGQTRLATVFMRPGVVWMVCLRVPHGGCVSLQIYLDDNISIWRYCYGQRIVQRLPTSDAHAAPASPASLWKVKARGANAKVRALASALRNNGLLSGCRPVTESQQGVAWRSLVRALADLQKLLPWRKCFGKKTVI